MDTAARAGQSPDLLATWLMVFVAWAFMYGPTYWGLASTLWQTEDQAHGAIVLVVVIWLIWDQRKVLLTPGDRPRGAIGGALFGFGLSLYLLGRSQDILILEIISQVGVLAGLVLVLSGATAMRHLWFALLYIVFMVPLPSILVDAVTSPLKQWVSTIAENMLYLAGYPIARSGVVLTIGQYQLLVADACSGLHSMFALAALGILFMYLMARKAWWHNAAMLGAILPIAFAANIVRVMVLVLVTYHLGDAAGQGFLHAAAGIVLLVSALLLLFALDSLLAKADAR